MPTSRSVRLHADVAICGHAWHLLKTGGFSPRSSSLSNSTNTRNPSSANPRSLTEEAVLTALHELCECLTFIREAEITVGTWVEACRLTKDVGPKDAPYVAPTLHPGAKLWTHDDELKLGLRAKGFDEFWEP